MILLKISFIISAILFIILIINQKEMIRQIEEEPHPFISSNLVFKVTLILSLIPGLNVYLLFGIIKMFIKSFSEKDE